MATTVDAKLLRATRFPPEFNQKVDMQKVNLQVMKKWIASRISEILGSEDDVVIELCFNLIEGPRFPDIKSLQIQLTGFLDKNTAPFCKELWKLCLSAQSSPQGVPKELLEAKKLELIQEKIDADKAAEEARNDETAASEEAAGTIGAEAGVAAIEPLMTAAEDLDAVRVEARHHQGETVIHIKGIVIATSLKGAAMADRGFAEDVPQPDQYLLTRAVPLGHDHQTILINVFGVIV
ncbi:PWI domain-containing protein [Xylaria intraflava]|nr:PWI domain-containing protein [Xylaria intraflava]